MTLQPDDATREAALELLAAGKLLQCLALLRERLGCSLPAAQAWIDGLQFSTDAAEQQAGAALEARRKAAQQAGEELELQRAAALRTALEAGIAPELLHAAVVVKYRERAGFEQASALLAAADEQQRQAAQLLAEQLERRAWELVSALWDGILQEAQVKQSLELELPGFSIADFELAISRAWLESR